MKATGITKPNNSNRSIKSTTTESEGVFWFILYIIFLSILLS